MSKKALALRIVGDPVTGAEMEKIREEVEDALGEDYNVLLYDDALQFMDMDDAIEDLKGMIQTLENRANREIAESVEDDL